MKNFARFPTKNANHGQMVDSDALRICNHIPVAAAPDPFPQPSRSRFTEQPGGHR
jgi:hypothetical protein